MKRMLFRAVAGVGVLSGLFASPLFSQTFHKYVALGDSLTAGVEGVCLVERHQNRSYPKLVADQLGISDFQQPLLSEKALTDASTPACQGTVVVGGTITVGAVSQTGSPRNLTLPRPYDNLGIPGAKTADLVDLKVSSPTGGTASLAATVILRNFQGGPFEGKSAVDEASLLNPDLVTVWAGPGDILSAELSAVATEGVTLTPVAVFEAKYTQLMSAIRGAGRTIVALNIPDETHTPFTTTIPPVVVNPTTRQPVLVGGQTVPLLGDRPTATCSTSPCPLPEGTLVTLGASSLLARGIGIPASLPGGTGVPLPNGSFSPPSTLNQGVLLYPDEVALMRQRTADLNAKIASIATANGATVMDAHALYEEIFAHGYEIGGGIVVTNAFLTGGVFSADGFHPSNIGYAIVAKEILQHLNSVEGTDFELPNMAEALFTPDVPVITATGVVDPAAGPFGFSLRMWKDLVRTTSSGEFEMVFPSPGKRSKPRIER